MLGGCATSALTPDTYILFAVRLCVCVCIACCVCLGDGPPTPTSNYYGVPINVQRVHALKIIKRTLLFLQRRPIPLLVSSRLIICFGYHLPCICAEIQLTHSSQFYVPYFSSSACCCCSFNMYNMYVRDPAPSMVTYMRMRRPRSRIHCIRHREQNKITEKTTHTHSHIANKTKGLKLNAGRKGMATASNDDKKTFINVMLRKLFFGQ